MSDKDRDFDTIAEMLSLSPDKREAIKLALVREQEVLDYQSSMRGKYLVYFAKLESAIEDLIATHFCKDEAYNHMLRSWVLKSIPFMRKQSILENILDFRDIEEMQKIRKHLLPDLAKINKFRNDITHLPPDVTLVHSKKDYDKTSFHLWVQDGPNIVRKEITKAQFEKQLEDVKRAASFIRIFLLFLDKEQSISKPKE